MNTRKQQDNKEIDESVKTEKASWTGKKLSAMITSMFVISMLVMCAVGVGAAAPSLNFISPTPADGTTTTDTSVVINVSVTADDLKELQWNWNGTNYTMYKNSLVLMMNFDNVSPLGEHYTTTEGYTILDLSEYGNNGTAWANGGATKGPEWVSTGRYGGALVFDGSEDYVQINSSDSLNITKNLTIGVWVNPKSYPAGSENGRIVSKGATYELAVGNTTGEVAFALMNDIDWYWRYTDDVVPLDEWTYIVLTYSSSTGDVTIYKNGTEVHSFSETGEITPDSGVLTIGRYAAVPEGYFNGTIDEPRIWNRSLSAEQVKQQYLSDLKKYNTDKWVFYTNQSSLTEATYTYQAFASDTTGAEKATEKRTVTAAATYIPPKPTNLANETGNYWVNYTWDAGSGVVTDSYNVSNGTAWDNGTTTTFLNETVGVNGWLNITVWAFNNTGAGNLSAESVSDKVEASAAPVVTTPPDPTNLQNTTGNYWVNYTWDAGTGGAATDSYNVSDGTSTWINGTANTYLNESVGPNGWLNITVWAYNSTYGNLSAGSVTDNVQVSAETAPELTLAVTPSADLTNTTVSVMSDKNLSGAPTVIVNGTLNVPMSTITSNTSYSGVFDISAGNNYTIVATGANEAGTDTANATLVILSDNYNDTETKTVNAPAINTTLDITVTQNMTNELLSLIRASTGPESPGLEPMLKNGYLQIDASSNLTTGIANIRIKLCYDAGDIPSNVKESLLRLYQYNETTKWVKLDGSVNTVEKCVYGYTTHLSSFGMFNPPPTIIHGPSDTTTTSSATITWTTDAPSDSTVEYGTTTGYGTIKSDPAMDTTSHSITLTELSAGTTYHYKVKSTNAAGMTESGDSTFKTTEPAKRSGGGGGGGGQRADTDLDGYTDFNEMQIGSDPHDPCDPNPDCAACLALTVAEEVIAAETTTPATTTPAPPTTAPPTTAAAPPTTPKEEEVPGFEAVFAIAGLLAVAYLVQRRKK